MMNSEKIKFEQLGLIWDEHKFKPMAMDAQPTLTTSPNSAILSLFTTYVDPKFIEVLFSPLKAVDVAGGEVKKGSWLDDTIAFLYVEPTGQVSSYGDFSEDGVANANLNFPQRQPYHYQTITRWGIRELERVGLTKLDWMNQKNMASVWTLNQYQNLSYFFGVGGLQNYGLLNDPALPAPIAPIPYPGPVVFWSDKTALQIYDDIVALATQLIQTQANGLVDSNTKMTLSLSPYADVQLNKSTDFNVNVRTLLKTNFPNLTIVTAPQFATLSGQEVQLKADLNDGQATEECSFTEKLRAFSIIVKSSSYTQKKMQGTNGAIIYRPMLIASMLGV